MGEQWGLKVAVTTDIACCRNRDNLIVACKRSLKAERAIWTAAHSSVVLELAVCWCTNTSASLALTHAHVG